MNMWLRLLYELLTWRLRTKLHWSDVGRRTFRVWPTDLDIFNHMNNGKFLTLFDLSRYDLALRSGAWQLWKKLGWYPVVVAATITYRKSLQPWQAFDMESKVIGWDAHAFYFDQRMVVAGEIYAQGIIRIRFLKRSRGIVTPDEVLAHSHEFVGEHPVLPEWVKVWAENSSLPKGKEPAPSDW
ncbi:thioesterase family protein [Rhodoluna sp.]|uniref:acyl-CoA thioesterase n=1 Tax=Rhodoluna sp. TaxID=1969481 RepID=UPI0025D90BB7|nr:thioesterase family protein [Rhodoluna sp.]